jgi:hypothetical protein
MLNHIFDSEKPSTLGMRAIAATRRHRRQDQLAFGKFNPSVVSSCGHAPFTLPKNHL